MTNNTSFFVAPYLAAVPLLLSSVLVQANEVTTEAVERSQHTKTIQVIGTAEQTGVDTQLTPESSAITHPIKDSGELLRSVNGVTALRRAGHGFEPIIRGQQQGQLNILSDGGQIISACPSRMDPATSYIGMESFDSVTVIKGNRSVIYGSGGSGGTVIFERQRPIFDDKPYQGKITLGHTDNSEATSGSIDVSTGGTIHGNQTGFIRAYAEKTETGNYDDGNGDTVSSSYKSLTQGILLGGDITESDYIQLGLEQSRQEDVYYSGNGMDSPYADADHIRAKWVHDASLGFVDDFELSVYRSDVNHLMDNYTVRDRRPVMGMPPMPMGMAAPSSTDSWGGRFLANTYLDSADIRYGADYKASNQKATRYMDNDTDYGNGFAMSTSILWPDAQLRNTGVFGEVDYFLSDVNTLRVGVRFDHWTAEAKGADDSYNMMPPRTPNGLYEDYYGYDADKRSENEISLVIGWDRKLSDTMTLDVNLSRTARAPDATELYIASDKEMMGNQNDWVGNPDLDFEIHHQVDINLSQATRSYSWSATAFYDQVEDYIERYQAGTGMNSIYKYRNVDALLAGVELEGQYKFTEELSTRATLAYTRGMNTEDSTDLSQIAPLEAHLYADYKTGAWGTGFEWVVADGQDHVSDTSGLDAGESTGFGVLHWQAHYNVMNDLTLKAGVENVFDKAYAYHVNAASVDPFSSDAVRVNEPGRQFWVKGEFVF
ncbi:TonB-dependent receptor domain-containing protein [Litoribrevibacter albus]|uniref:TonB-dependent receptor n=1 Tax=Litoribrevibacter albus TaxID=1473156 RepID=A0AA37SBP0_9GAMM|nr:TonB-dependent receptor [Litoribrevibacter albus]GLQ31581.1 TonB-dependent receptor [Litoribrevibacter albus]